MNHITTRKKADGLDILYQAPGADINAMTPLDRASRAIIGLSFPLSGADYGYGCAVVERVWWPHDDGIGSLPARQYVLVDEISSQTPRELFDAVVALKDRYYCEAVACPKEPAAMVEALRRHEGLVSYPEFDPIFLRDRFPTFVGTDVTAYVREVAVADGAAIARDMDAWWEEEILHPSSGVPIFAGSFDKPLKKLVVLGASTDANYSTREAAQGIQTGDMVIRTAVWLAVKSLEDSIWIYNSRKGQRRGEKQSRWKPGRSGY